MIRRGLCVLAMLSSCVLSLPLTPSQQENEDVKVMRCIVEALADVLSRPRPLPVSQDCLLTLRSDDRLVSILRHRSFLKELQEIALRGGEGAQQGGGQDGGQDAGQDAPDGATPESEAVGDVPDRSMLEALGSPGERSILSEQTKAGNGDAGEDESREDGQDGEEKRESEKPGSPPSAHSEEESSERKDEKRRAEKDHEEEPKEGLIQDHQGGSGEKRSAHRSKEEDKEKRAAQASHKHQEKHKDESHQRWTERGQSTAVKHQAPHHSKEVVVEEEEEEEEREERRTQASPEQKQLQLIARRRHEEKRGSEEEGSASRKLEDQEIESLAAIESELESAAQKLHELRRG